MPTSRFSFRALTSLVLFWTFLSLLLTGIVLYISPKGRIAHWTDWHLIGLDKEQWAAVHTMMAITFIIGGLFHLLKFNRHVIWTYVVRSREERSQFRWAVVGSIVVFTLVVAGTLSDLQPFAAVMDTSDRFRNGWIVQGNTPPTPHLEEQSLAQVAQRLGIDADDACASLRSQSIECSDPSVSLKEIAVDNAMSPAELYRMLQPEPVSVQQGADGHGRTQNDQGHGAGWGRMTVVEAARSRSIDPQQAIESLRRHGIEAEPDHNLRELAQRYGLRPGDLAEIMSSTADASID